jgi:thymidine kinase
MGPMFAGKSAELLRECKKLLKLGYDVYFVRPKADTRGYIARNHDSSFYDEHDRFHLLDDSLLTIEGLLQTRGHGSSKRIFVDEAQFLNKESLNALLISAKFHNITFAGLSGDTHSKPWYNIALIQSHCDEIELLHARCKCGERAIYTRSYKPVSESGDKYYLDGVLIGDDNYYPVCCWCVDEETDDE